MTDIDEPSHQKSSSEDEEENEHHYIITSGGHYDPQKWTYLKKYWILFLIALPTFLTPLSNA